MKNKLREVLSSIKNKLIKTPTTPYVESSDTFEVEQLEQRVLLSATQCGNLIDVDPGQVDAYGGDGGDDPYGAGEKSTHYDDAYGNDKYDDGHGVTRDGMTATICSTRATESMGNRAVMTETVEITKTKTLRTTRSTAARTIMIPATKTTMIPTAMAMTS